MSSESSSEPVPIGRSPTVFDIIAQENMQSLFRTSFNHFFKWLMRHSASVRRFRRFSDAIYLLVHSSVEFLYLKAYNALFAEYFYGMKRHSLTENTQRALSVVYSVVVPYAKAKLDEFYEELEKSVEEHATHPTTTTTFGKLKSVVFKLLLKFYPYFHLYWSAVFWLFRFRFMVGKSECSSPLLRVLGMKLVYDSERDSTVSARSILGKVLTCTNYCFTGLLFFVQFLQWYEQYNESWSFGSEEAGYRPLFGFLAKTGAEDRDLVTPPKLPEKLAASKTYKAIEEKNLCPLCTRPRRNECVLSVSGFVFCYPCVFKFVKEHQRCPLTNYPCSFKNIIRIYDSSD